MPLTPNLSTVTVSGTYVDIQGNAIAGQVKFTPRAILTDAAADQIVIPITVTVTLDTNGGFSVVLPVTDDTSLAPTGFTYYVEESFSGGRTYDISLPISGGATINLADVAPAQPNTGAGAQYVLLSSYATLNSQVQSMVTTVNTATNVTTQINTATTNAANAATAAANTTTAAQQYADNLIHPFLLMGV